MRTDQNGRELPAVLAYELNRPVQEVEIHKALNIVAKTYKLRSSKDDFPSAEDCRRLGEYFDLNPVDLMYRFGHIDVEQIEQFLEGLVPATPRGHAKTLTAPKKKGQITRNKRVPPM